jgi:hypothetical protein
MRTIGWLGTMAFAIATVVACGEDSKDVKRSSRPEVAQARAKLDGKPTGSFTSANANRIATALRRDTEAGKTAQSLGPSGSGSSSSALRVMSIRPMTKSAIDACPDYEARKEVGSCACDEGLVRYDIPNLAALESSSSVEEADVQLTFEKCKLNGQVSDGTLAIHIGPSKTVPGTKDTLFVVNMAIDDTRTAVAFALKGGEIWYAEDVSPDGKYVLVKLEAYAEGNGTYTVQAENGEFACALEAGAGTCTNAKSGEKLAVKEDGATATPPSDPPADDPPADDELPPDDDI